MTSTSGAARAAGAASGRAGWAARLVRQALWATAWWGGPLVLAAALVGRTFPQVEGALALALGVWLSYACHELGHAVAAVARGSRMVDVRLERRGPGLAVVAPVAARRDRIVIALAGPAAGIASGLVVVLGGGALGGVDPTQLVVAAVLVTIHHAVNLLPFAPDGAHLLGR